MSEDVITDLKQFIAAELGQFELRLEQRFTQQLTEFRIAMEQNLAGLEERLEKKIDAKVDANTAMILAAIGDCFHTYTTYTDDRLDNHNKRIGKLESTWHTSLRNLLE